MLVPRWASLVLISSQGVTNWGFRNALPSWLPLLAVSLNLSDAQRALLMSSFFPGYLLTQVPGSWAIQRYGAAQSFPNLLVGALFF
jgi:fucose permease